MQTFVAEPTASCSYDPVSPFSGRCVHSPSHCRQRCARRTFRCNRYIPSSICTSYFVKLVGTSVPRTLQVNQLTRSYCRSRSERLLILTQAKAKSSSTESAKAKAKGSSTESAKQETQFQSSRDLSKVCETSVDLLLATRCSSQLILASGPAGRAMDGRLARPLA